MSVLKHDRILAVDVDDTLLLWDRSEYPESTWVSIYNIENGKVVKAPLHTKNINLLIKFQKLGYNIIVWSRSGYQWAQSVGDAIGLTNVEYGTKPLYYLDDTPADKWMQRIWRDPHTGEDRV